MRPTPAIRTMHAIVAAAVAAAASMLGGCESPHPQSPAIRLVQTELRRELRTHYLRVARIPPDTLLVVIQGGREAVNPSAVGPPQREGIARRAVELLVHPPAPTPADLQAVVVEVERTRQIGPLVFGTTDSRTTYDVDSLRARTDSAAALRLP